MNWIRRGSLRLALVLALCMLGAYSMAQSSNSQNVVAQAIIATRASSKVAAVLWTRRTDHYTFQVVFPKPSRVSTGRKNPIVTFWLLGADGATIPTSRDVPEKNNSTSEISYSVSLPSGESAVAVALKIDDDYFIEKLRPLN